MGKLGYGQTILISHWSHEEQYLLLRMMYDIKLDSNGYLDSNLFLSCKKQ